MEGLYALNLIHLLDFYFAFMFLASSLRRLDQYRAIVGLVFSGPARWPKLLQVVKEHRMLFLTWPTVLPALLALLLTLLQLLASRQLWPSAQLTLATLLEMWPALFVVVPFSAAMVAVDLYFVLAVGAIDRQELEPYFDQAEYWLRSKAAHVVRVFTLGAINPRGMVAQEVQKALIDATRMLNTTLWWLTVQYGLRLGCGLSLWLTWALS